MTCSKPLDFHCSLLWISHAWAVRETNLVRQRRKAFSTYCSLYTETQVLRIAGMPSERPLCSGRVAEWLLRFLEPCCKSTLLFWYLMLGLLWQQESADTTSLIKTFIPCNALRGEALRPPLVPPTRFYFKEPPLAVWTTALGKRNHSLACYMVASSWTFSIEFPWFAWFQAVSMVSNMFHLFQQRG